MKTKIFLYSKNNQQKIALLFLGLAVAGAAMALYMWLWTDRIRIKTMVGGIFLTILGLVFFLKWAFAPKRENETAVVISDEGITANTTPIAKGAGLIEWADIEAIQLYTRLLEIRVSNPDKYAGRMKSFFVRDTFLKAVKGTVKISLTETNATYNEVLDILEPYAQQHTIHINKETAGSRK